MAAVMQKDGQGGGLQLSISDVIPFAPQQLDRPSHQMHGSQAMGKSGVVGVGIYHVGETHLLDSSQTLEKGMLDDVKMELVRNVDKAIYGIVDDFFLVGFHILYIGVRN